MTTIFDRVSWECVHFFTDPDRLSHLLAVSAPPPRVAEITDVVTDDKDLFSRLASVLEFPEYFGHNWDALDECLRTLDPGSGWVLIMRRGAESFAGAPLTLGRFISAWLLAAGHMSEKAAPFHLVFAFPPPSPT